MQCGMWDLSSPIRELWASPGSYWAWGWVCAVLCLVTQSCPTLCDPMDCNMPDFPVLHCLPGFAQTHVHWVNDAIQRSHPLLSLLLLLSIFPSIRVFFSESALDIKWPKYWKSASASVLPVNIQGWFPLRFTGWISFQSNGLSRVFSSSVTQSCPTLCNPMNHSTPGFPVHHQLPELAQTHVHLVGDAIQPSHSLSPSYPPAIYFPSIRVFSNESALCIRWTKYWSFSLSPSNEYSWLISFKIDRFDLPAVQGTLKSLL